jgi:hypothetical protein
MQSDKPKPIEKILIISANPKGTSPLRLDEEHRRIKDSLKQSDRRSQFDIRIESAVTIAHIRRALLEHKPKIVHFCGHGLGTDGIICENESGQIKLIPTAALSNLFKLVRSHVKCVVLNACFAEIQANEIVKHIEFVVGMSYAIGDEAALRFAEGFYDALFAGKEFVDCYKWGVNAIQLESISEDSIPIIKQMESISKDSTPIIKMKVPVKKAVKIDSQKLSKVSISSTEKKSAAPSPHPKKPALGNPDPIPGTSPHQIPLLEKYPLLRQMPKRTFLGLLILAFPYIIFTTTDSTGTNQGEIAGSYTQEIEMKNINERGGTSDHIRWDAISTKLTVLFNARTRRWEATETTFWKVYYAPDLSHLEKRFIIGASKSEFVHKECAKQSGGKIQMYGAPGEGQRGLQVEPISGDQKLIKEVTEAVNKEIIFIKANYKAVWTQWSMDEGGNLIKEKWYDTEDGLGKKNRGEPGEKEKFRQLY